MFGSTSTSKLKKRFCVRPNENYGIYLFSNFYRSLIAYHAVLHTIVVLIEQIKSNTELLALIFGQIVRLFSKMDEIAYCGPTHEC